MADENSYFNKALSDFVMDFSFGDAIRRMTQKGYTIDEIRERLDMPLTRERVAETVWKYYLSEGLILREEPPENGVREKVDYVTDTNAYGRKTMRRVTETIESDEKYLPCDFGRRIYKDKEGFAKILIAAKDEKVKDHVLSLPWPLETVYVSEKLLIVYKILETEKEAFEKGKL